jgi:hypothetical protein
VISSSSIFTPFGADTGGGQMGLFAIFGRQSLVILINQVADDGQEGNSTLAIMLQNVAGCQVFHGGRILGKGVCRGRAAKDGNLLQKTAFFRSQYLPKAGE